MEPEDKVLAKKRKINMELYSIHRMLTFDLLFYYAIKFLFLGKTKVLSEALKITKNTTFSSSYTSRAASIDSWMASYRDR